MKPNLTPDYHRILEEIRILASEKNRHRRRWQQTRDLADKSAFNRAAGKVPRDMQAFRNRWGFTISETVVDSSDNDAYV